MLSFCNLFCNFCLKRKTKYNSPHVATAISIVILIATNETLHPLKSRITTGNPLYIAFIQPNWTLIPFSKQYKALITGRAARNKVVNRINIIFTVFAQAGLICVAPSGTGVALNSSNSSLTGPRALVFLKPVRNSR